MTQNQTQIEIYEQVRAQAEPLIKHYFDDLLKIDRELITEPAMKGVPFLHFTGKTGTHIVFLHPAGHPEWPAIGEQAPYVFGHAYRGHILDDKCISVESLSDGEWRGRLILYYDGTGAKNNVSKVTPDKARAICYEYEARVKREWSAEEGTS